MVVVVVVVVVVVESECWQWMRWHSFIHSFMIQEAGMFHGCFYMSATNWSPKQSKVR